MKEKILLANEISLLREDIKQKQLKLKTALTQFEHDIEEDHPLNIDLTDTSITNDMIGKYLFLLDEHGVKFLSSQDNIELGPLSVFLNLIKDRSKHFASLMWHTYSQNL